MELGNASLLGFVIFILVELYDAFENGDWKARRKLAFIVIAGQIVALAVAHSDWGAKQVVKGISLNVMNGVSLALVGLAVAGLIAFGNKVAVKALSRIGSGGEL